MWKTQIHKEKVEQNIDDEVAETIRKNTRIVEEFRKINWTHHFFTVFSHTINRTNHFFNVCSHTLK